ncbi:restriction endonuclease subunit S [Romboutsia sp. 1001713B170131_170501_G6]|uniref:restriction endonuclease subunit S n=1 Tax=Romboutsia sp. 1001713B170131_170501_G6 TaxID=2787108 RepID=UPI0018AA8D0F|nr:restriction endonuclease subunit S [Romboutsia sp. 1001713B170131_170501_G6]
MAKKKLTIDDVLVPKDEIPYEVPENWCWVKLGYISKVTMGQSPKGSSYNDEGIGEILINGPVEFGPTPFSRTLEKKWTTEPTKMCDKDDIIMCVRGSVGKLNIAGNSACIGRGVCAIKPFINEKYLLYILNFKQDEISRMGTGTTFLNISSKDIHNISIPVPPLAEQERIVNRIESLFEKVDKAAGLVDEAREGFEKRRAAILERAFSGELTKKWREENGVSDEWNKISLEGICSFKNGLSKRSGKEGIDKKVLRLADINIKEHKIYCDESRVIKLVDKEIEKYKVENNDLLLIRVNGSRNIVGKVVVYEGNDIVAYCDHLIKITPDNKLILNKYLWYLINSDSVRKILLDRVVSSAGQNTISQGSLSGIIVKLSTIDEQNEIIYTLDKLFNSEFNIEELAGIGENIDIIKKSILAKAFRGELGSNDLDEESSIQSLIKLI